MKILAALTIGLVMCAQSSIAAPAKQSIAVANVGAVSPAAVPSKPAAHSGQSKAISRTQLRRKAKSSYPRTHLERAKYFKAKGNLNAALVEYLRATQENPRLVAAYYEQAVIFRQRGFLKLAESSLERALAVNKDFNQGRILLATVRLEQGNLGGAAEELSRSLGLAAPQTKAISRQSKSSESTAKNTSEEIESSPTSILQSLHEFLPDPFSGSPKKSARSMKSGESGEPGESGDRSDAKNGSADDNSRKDAQLDESKQDDPFFSIQVRLPNPLKMFHWLSEDSRDKRKPKSSSRSKLTERKQRSEETNQKHDTEDGAERRKPRSWLSKFMQLPEQPNSIDQREQSEDRLQDKVSEEGNKLAAAEARAAALKEELKAAEQKAEELKAAELKAAEARVAEQKAASAKAAELQEAQEKLSAERSAREETTDSVQGWDAKASALESATAETKTEIATTTTGTATETVTATTANAIAIAPAADKPWNLPLPSFTATGFFAAFNRLCATVSTAPMPESKPPAQPEDEWVKRLRYLNEHGTSTLKDGEAFMFSEDTGEAVLILASGKRIQRIIAQPQDMQEVLKLRRPDVLIPQELMYNLSLLGRLMPREETELQRVPSNTQQPSPSPSTSTSTSSTSTSSKFALPSVKPNTPLSEIDKPFASGEMLGRREGIVDWFRGILKL